MKTLIALTLLLSTTLTGAADKPNIVFIFSDDHATAAISAYNSHLKDAAPTPNIDRLAKEGVIFENSFCANSICGPSRANILTGKHSHINGFLDNNNSRFDGTQTTFPKLLQEVGYQTALVGKWHLSSDPTGFDYWEILPGQGSYNNPDLIQQDGGRKRYKGYVTDIVTDRSIDWLETRRDKSKPFVLMCQHKAPHRNWSPAPRHYNLFDDVTMPEPETLFDDYGGDRSKTLKQHEMGIENHFFWGWDMKFHGESQFPKHFMKGLANLEYKRFDEDQKKVWDAAYQPKNDQLIADIKSGKLKDDEITRWKYQRYIKDYLRCIRAVDENVGRVLDYLDKNGLAENTLVIYSSDQGFYLGEHGWYDKRWMFEESLEMPFLARWPAKIPAGKRSKTLIQNIDYAPTFLEIAGADIPDSIQGKSLLPALTNPEKSPESWRDAIYYTYYGERTHGVARHDGVRTQTHKLIRFPDTDEWNLFDLVEDPNEMQSFHADPAYSQILSELKKIYTEKRDKYKVSDATIPRPRLDQAWWKKRHQEKIKEARNAKQVDLLFLGDSITHGWEGQGKQTWEKYYAGRNALNLGYGGDRTQHLNWRLLNSELPENVNPKVAVVMIGTNNTGHVMQAADETAAGIGRVIEILRDRRPDTKILVLGIFPRDAKPDGEMRIRNDEVNALVRELADGDHVHFMDIASTFLNGDGTLPKEMMPDFLHPNAKGYDLWAGAIEDKLCELGGWEKVE
ncbi:MAG: arylsulfatase A-like enzyme/lysophospholipase L1-like esterase [Pseudoalteromonas tetraodonis]|jgi:arylsulfatase A-like enzyme/lysophospholipase L1-like esterase